MVPPDAYRGEKRMSSKPLDHTPISCVKISLNVSNPRVTCGKGKLMAGQIISKTLVWVLFVHVILGKCYQKTDSKDHHLKSTVDHDKSLSLQGIFSATHDWHSMTIVIQIMGDITLFWVINILL